MGVEQLAPAIRKGDLVQLVSIPGIGRKIAERIVLELRDKVTALDTGGSGSARPVTKSELESDVGSALVNLGYDARTVEKTVDEAQRSSGARDFETLLRAALQILAGGKMDKTAHAARGTS